MATYGIGFVRDRNEYYVVINGTRVEQAFPTVGDALAHCDEHRKVEELKAKEAQS